MNDKNQALEWVNKYGIYDCDGKSMPYKGLRAVRQSLIMHQWLPIETAPKNGEEILVAQNIPATVFMVVRYDDSDALNPDQVWRNIDQTFHKDLFTHWMPLPPGPESE